MYRRIAQSCLQLRTATNVFKSSKLRPEMRLPATGKILSVSVRQHSDVAAFASANVTKESSSSSSATTPEKSSTSSSPSQGAVKEGSEPPAAAVGDIEVHYITKDDRKITIMGVAGDNLMHLAQRNGVEIEGACEASLACCTCHVYVNQPYFDRLEPASEEEEDLLDMAPFLKENSRLGCQVILNKDLAGIEVKLPPATRNFYVDGAKPSHH